ncbi:MAG TPA: hypothetical protein VFX88_11100 [Actinomycetota bacterium]|nr:hypothetical protein [Actinomycetota bacterium]
MRRIIVVALSAALLTTTAWVVHGTAAGPTSKAGTTTPVAANTGSWTDERALERGARMADPARPGNARLPLDPPPATAASDGDTLATQLARARLATGRYATNLGAAKADGYQIITRMIPDMGWHFLNPAIQGFDVTKPAILVYERRGRSWQLGALEWVFTETPASPPLPGATYGSFPAACHYTDGTFVFARVQELCAKRSPETGARFNFWHPDLVTLHVWLWYPNPDGLYSGTNPLVRPFNQS